MKFNLDHTVRLAGISFFGFILAWCTTVHGDELVLIDNGTSYAPVVYPEGAPPKLVRAANELADYMERISGVRPEVIEGAPDPLPSSAIWVGYQPVLGKLFPDTSFEFNKREEILLTANDSHLALVGRDRWNPDALNVLGVYHPVPIEGRQLEYGSINAVYTFLQDWLDIRWFWPGELGTDVIESERIALKPFEYRYAPVIWGRNGVLRLSALDNRTGNSRDWVRLQRLQLDSMETPPSGHAFSDWHSRFYDTNRDLFAMQPDGERRLGAGAPKNIKVCSSNPDVWQQWLRDVEDTLERDPNAQVFQGGQNDGASSGLCICPECVAWDHPDGERAMWTWQGAATEYVATSDRDVTFWNKLGELLKDRFPDEDYYVRGMAYSTVGRPAPVEARPAENVMIAYVGNFPFREDSTNSDGREGGKKRFAEWADFTSAMIYRPNTGGVVGLQQGLPDYFPVATEEDWRFLADHNCVGIMIDTIWEHWATQGPQYYLMAQLSWNPYADGEAIMADYFNRAFGPAADAIAAYWQTVEDRRYDFVRVYDRARNPMQEVFSAEHIANLQRRLNDAKAAVADADEVYGERVAFVQAGLDYVKLYIQLESKMEAISEGQVTAASQAQEVNELIDAIRQISRDYPYSLFYQTLQLPHPWGRINRIDVSELGN